MALLPASFRQEYIVCISISGSAALQSPATACNRSAIGGHCTAGNTNILTPLNEQCTQREVYTHWSPLLLSQFSILRKFITANLHMHLPCFGVLNWQFFVSSIRFLINAQFGMAFSFVTMVIIIA